MERSPLRGTTGLAAAPAKSPGVVSTPLTLSHIQLSARPVGSHSKPNPFQVLLSVSTAASGCGPDTAASPGQASPPSPHAGTSDPFCARQPDLLKT